MDEIDRSRSVSTPGQIDVAIPGHTFRMKQNTLATDSAIDARRAAARRTALWLGVAALAIFVGFIAMAVTK
jgi:hypothetical protein